MTRKTKDDSLITEEQLWDVLSFARELYSSMLYPSALTPELISSRLKDVTLNPLAVSEESLTKALRDVKNSELELQSFAQEFEIISMPYKRSLLFLASIPAFDFTITCVNAEEKDYGSSAYKKDEKKVWEFLEVFNVKEQFSTVLKQLLRQETFFGWFRDDNPTKYVLQELPSSPRYTKITGRWSNGLLGSFSMSWFLQPGVSLDFYPPFFKKKFLEIFGKNSGKIYNPEIDLNKRGLTSEGDWVYWVDLPIDDAVIFKLDPSIATRLPFFLPMFSDWINQPLYRNLQKQKAIASAVKLIFGEVPMLNKDAKTAVKDSLAITPDTLGKFLALVKAGIGDALKVTSAPLQNVGPIDFPLGADGTMYEDWIRTTTAATGINSNLIFSSTQKMNAIETRLSMNVDEIMMEKIYPMFEEFMNFKLHSVTGKYKFKISFEGSNIYLNRQERLDNQLKLANVGIVLPQKIAAALGMNPNHFYRQLEQGRAMGFVSKLTPITPATNMPGSGADKNAGRPSLSDNELGDSGLETKSQGSNEEK